VDEVDPWQADPLCDTRRVLSRLQLFRVWKQRTVERGRQVDTRGPEAAADFFDRAVARDPSYGMLGWPMFTLYEGTWACLRRRLGRSSAASYPLVARLASQSCLEVG